MNQVSYPPKIYVGKTDLSLIPPDEFSSEIFDSTGEVTVPSTGESMLVASIDCQSIGACGINVFIASGSLADFTVAFATARLGDAPLPSGQSVPRLVASAGDFDVIDDMLTSCSESPLATMAGNAWYADFDFQGRFQRVDIYAQSVTPGTVIVLDVSGSNANVC